MSKILKKSLTVFLLLFTISFSTICCNANYGVLVEQLNESYTCCITIKHLNASNFLIREAIVPLAEILGFLSEIEPKEIPIQSNYEPCLNPSKPPMKKALYYISNNYQKDIFRFVRRVKNSGYNYY